jgi:3-methyladenine DNA glycosylase/8-oxoguanine DNA glycosylase
MEQMESGTTTPLRDEESPPDRYAAARTYLRRADPVLGRLIETLRTLAERFIVDGLGEQAFLSSSDEEIEAKLTAIPGIGPWTVRGFLMIALDRDAKP